MKYRRVFLYVIAFFVMYLMLKKLKNSSKSNFGCKVPEEVQENLIKLASKVHSILNSLGVTHFLCYGTLWGALRYNRLLPWEQDVEFCAINEKVLYLDEARLLREFRKHSLELEYDWSEGFYTIFNSSKRLGSVEIYVFELDTMNNMLKRVGWKRRVLPPNCENTILHCFPPRLAKTPLPEKELSGVTLPVPREEIEIQKYFYPDDWWKENKSEDC
uniref:LicD family protein n=1 Tax=Strigamia maritima TaxID=126957 RepID=T1J0Q1_STRMM